MPPVGASASLEAVLAEVGPRLRRLRHERRLSLAELAAATDISKSTLSRLESGQRKPSLELLLPIAAAHQVPLGDLVGAPEVGDPRVRFVPQDRNGRTVVPLTRHDGGIQAWKVIIEPSADEPRLRIHEGYEWLYVLSGELRLVVADRDLVLTCRLARHPQRLPHEVVVAKQVDGKFRGHASERQHPPSCCKRIFGGRRNAS